MSQTTETQTSTQQTPHPVPGEGSIINEGAAGNTGNTLLGDVNIESGAGTESSKPGQQGTPQKHEQDPESVTGLAPLPDNASDEQRADFDKKLRALAGVPGKPEDYDDFGFGDEAKIDTSADDYKYYTKLFHDVGISKSQAKKLLEAHIKYARGQVEHFQKQSDGVINEYRAQVKREFVKSVGGEEAFSEYRDTAVRGFKASAQGAKLTEKEVASLLNTMGDDPRFIKIFNGIGKMFREDVLITGAAPKAQEKTFDDMFKDMFKGG